MSYEQLEEGAKIATLLPQFVKRVLLGDTPIEATAEELTALLPLAEAHDLAHFVGAVLFDMDLPCPPEVKEAYISAYRRAVYRHGLMQYEEERVISLLASQGIDSIKLKGAILKDIYPQPWLRTCADVDILLREKTVARAARLMVERLGYRKGKEGGHDLSLHSPSGVHFEMHFCLNERDRLTDRHLKRVWEMATATPDAPHTYKLPDDIFYLYQTSHAMKHFTLGGCGVRTVADFWLMSQHLGLTPEGCKALLDCCHLFPFAEALLALGEVWFDEGEHTEITRLMERYILFGGVFGTEEQASLVEQTRGGGRLGYFFRRLFLPLSVLREDYPVLNRHKLLYPFCQLHRWITLLFSREKRERATRRSRHTGDRDPYLYMIKTLKLR